MTAVINRRRKPRHALPAQLVAWFSGERTTVPMVFALAFPHGPLLPERWRAWVAEHPGATPPAGYEWLSDPEHPRQKFYGPELASARGLARKSAATAG